MGLVAGLCLGFLLFPVTYVVAGFLFSRSRVPEAQDNDEAPKKVSVTYAPDLIDSGAQVFFPEAGFLNEVARRVCRHMLQAGPLDSLRGTCEAHINSLLATPHGKESRIPLAAVAVTALKVSELVPRVSDVTVSGGPGRTIVDMCVSVDGAVRLAGDTSFELAAKGRVLSRVPVACTLSVDRIAACVRVELGPRAPVVPAPDAIADADPLAVTPGVTVLVREKPELRFSIDVMFHGKPDLLEEHRVQAAVTRLVNRALRRLKGREFVVVPTAAE